MYNMDVFGKIAEKRKEIEEATRVNIAKSFIENFNDEDVEIEDTEKSFDDELNEVRDDLFDEVKKAKNGIYADNSLNRKLMRVGQSYGTNSKFKPHDIVRAKLPTGSIVEGEYLEPYGQGKHTIKSGNKLYGVDEKSIELIKKKWRNKISTAHQLRTLTDKADEIYDELRSLREKRKNLALEMEDVLSTIGEEINNGENELVVKYSEALDELDENIYSLSSKHKKISDKIDKMYNK